MASNRGPSRAGWLLRKWLKKHGKTQQWFADKIGVHQMAVSQWMAGMEPKASRAAAINKITGIPVAAWGEYETETPTGTTGR